MLRRIEKRAVAGTLPLPDFSVVTHRLPAKGQRWSPVTRVWRGDGDIWVRFNGRWWAVVSIALVGRSGVGRGASDPGGNPTLYPRPAPLPTCRLTRAHDRSLLPAARRPQVHRARTPTMLFAAMLSTSLVATVTAAGGGPPPPPVDPALAKLILKYEGKKNTSCAVPLGAQPTLGSPDMEAFMSAFEGWHGNGSEAGVIAAAAKLTSTPALQAFLSLPDSVGTANGTRLRLPRSISLLDFRHFM